MRTFILAVFLVACAHAAPHAKAPSFQPTAFTVTVSGHGRPVIFIPGLACGADVWQGTIDHLGGKVEAHVLTLAGFAGQPPIYKDGDGPWLPTVRDQIIQYVKDRHLDHPILVGHSLGSFMAIWVAETAPDLIGGVIGVDGAPFFSAIFDPNATAESSERVAKMMRDEMVHMTPEQFAQGERQYFSTMLVDQSALDRLMATSGKSDPVTTGESMYELMKTDLRGDLGKITAPVLLVAADTNGEVPRENVEKAWHAQLDLVPKHEVVVVDKSKHFIMVDQPAAFYQAIDGFLSKTR